MAEVLVATFDGPGSLARIQAVPRPKVSDPRHLLQWVLVVSVEQTYIFYRVIGPSNCRGLSRWAMNWSGLSWKRGLVLRWILWANPFPLARK